MTDEFVPVPRVIGAGLERPTPFRPGAAPVVVAGRSELRRRIAAAVAGPMAAGGSGRVILLVGARGTGKTTLCDWMVEHVAWPAGWIGLMLRGDVAQPLAAQVSASWRIATGDTSSAAPRAKVKVDLTLPALVGLSIESVERRPTAEPATLLDAVRGPARLLAEAGTGLVVVVDEAQAASAAQLAEVVQVLEHGHDREGLPVVVLLAGTDRLPRHINHRGAVGSLGMLARGERFDVPVRQDDDDTAGLLAATLDAAGMRITREAADAIHARTGGYPYGVQVYGQQAFADAVERGGARVASVLVADVDTSAPRSLRIMWPVLEAFWDGDAQRGPEPGRAQEYIRAVVTVAASGAAVTHGAVCDALGVAQSARSRELRQLVDRGVLVLDGAALAFAIPDMLAYVAAR